MSKYVMSDLHGCYDKFIKMLDVIKLKETDELYILGDIFDRGDKCLEILDYIISHKNIILIKGNHEKLFEEYFEEGDCQLWYYNGGQNTHNQILKKTFFEEELIYKYIKKLPFIKVVDNFILVHAGLYFPENYEELTIDEFISIQEEDTCLWDRSNVRKDNIFNGYRIICGHTPVQTINYNYTDVKIIHKKCSSYIDCGCVFENSNGKLACLRLDDMKEFYI